MDPVAIFALFAVAIVVFAVIGFLKEKKRRQAMEKLAAELGFSYSPKKDRALVSQFSFLDKFGNGRNRYAKNVMSGEVDGRKAMVFDYHYETHSHDSDGKRKTNHHYFTIFTLELCKHFPELIIRPEGFFSKFKQMLGFDDINFESVEFSKRYQVKSKDKKFAYDVCNAQMIDYLLQQNNLDIEIERNVLSFTFRGRMKIELMRPNIERIKMVRSFMPNYLFAK
ncbi:MAG: hypothetical protein AB8D78_04895 [Akkermansiaceae bacterium]